MDVSGIPNMGFGGGNYFGTLGGIPNQQPAMSAAQINASMGWNPYAQASATNIYGPQGFGGLTDYYSGLGAAYGRATGGFNRGHTVNPGRSGVVTRGDDLPAPPTQSPLPQGQPFSPGMTSAPRSPFTGMSFGGNRDFLAHLMRQNASPQPPALTPPPNQGQQDFQSLYGPRALPLYMPPMPTPSVTVPGQQGSNWYGMPTASS